jgi:hypothetical protein
MNEKLPDSDHSVGESDFRRSGGNDRLARSIGAVRRVVRNEMILGFGRDGQKSAAQRPLPVF